jgi:hypothetical protein
MRIATAPLFALLLVGCDPHTEASVGPYRLRNIDDRSGTSVVYDLGDQGSVGRIGPTVFAIGWNDAYVVAARHPIPAVDTTPPSPNGRRSIQPDRSRTEYFYIVRRLDRWNADPGASVRGPFDDAAFHTEITRLHLPAFRKVLADLK